MITKLSVVSVACVFMLSSVLSELIPNAQPFAGELDDSCRRARTGASPKSPGDNGFRIRVFGNPSSYIPGELYQISLEGTQTRFYFRKFIGFMLTVGAKEEENYITPRPDAGAFNLAGDPLLRFSEECQNAVTESSLIPKREIQLMWRAPPAGVGCVIFRAVVQENPERWYMGEGNLVLEFCEEGQRTPVENQRTGGCCACGTAQYELEFKGLWSKETHPKDFPTNVWLTHFSDIIGASHTQDYRVWEADSYASEGVKDVAEKGATRKLEAELKQSGKTYSVFKARGLWYPNVNGISTTDFRVDDQHPSVSLLTMLSPSSDWILGVDSLQLCLPNCSWVTEKILDLDLWDAGTAEGVTYVSRRHPTIPQERIQRITASYPNNPLSPFYDPSGLPGKPFAQLTLRQQQFEAKPCGEGEPVTSDSNEEDNEDESCSVSDWTEFSPCSVSCGDGFRMRSRHYLEPKKADMNSCNVKLLDKEPCQEICVGCLIPFRSTKFLDRETENDIRVIFGKNVSCRTTDWGEWSECSVTCGKGFRTRNRRYLEYRARKICSAEVTQKDPCMGMKQECEGPETIDSLCSVTSWSSWSPCTSTCGEGVKVRTRLYYSPSSLSVCNISLMEKMPCTGLKASCDMNFAETKEICMLPKDVGPCRGYFSRWHFDSDRLTCLQFVYGGCRGNMNNFELQRDCLRTCENIFSAPIIDCMVTPWSDWTPCSQTCGNGYQERNRMIKLNPENGGKPCPENLTQRRRCADIPSCSESNIEDKSEICMLPKDVGPCRAYYPRWYFDADKRYCAQFIYGGCEGNMNNFALLRDCQHTCEAIFSALPNEKPYDEAPVDAEHQENFPVDCMVTPWSEWTPCTSSCGTGRKERRRMIKVQSENGGRPCPERLIQRRRCNDNPSCSPAAETNSEHNVDEAQAIDCMVTPWSDWTPCSQTCGNGQKERHRMIKVNPENGGKPCPEKLKQKRRCTDIPSCSEINIEDKSEICMLPKDVGPCRAYFPRWYFDADRRYCAQFIYGGCEGNMNNFALLRDCLRTCEAIFSDVDCILSHWSDWTPCSKTCGDLAFMERIRMITQHPRNNGEPCGHRVERKYCRLPPCPP